MNLEMLGWSPFFSKSFAPYAEQGYRAGRVAREHRNMYEIFAEEGELQGEVSGRMRHQTVDRGDFPAVGDWVVIGRADGAERHTIHALLPRKSKFSRNAAGGTTEEQIVAANIDTAFLVTGLDDNFNPRRIERYLILAWESGADPVIVLTKADLCDDLERYLDDARAVALGVPVIPVSSPDGGGLDRLAPYLGAGRTAVLLGSSGVGKSTLTNRLAGAELLKVGEVSGSVGKGKHTTTHREMILLPGGGLIIDTPGMRELQLWEADEGLQETFEDIASLAERCRFRDCGHGNEPGCAIRRALDDGTLDAARYRNYTKMERELAYLVRKDDKAAALAEKERWKKIGKESRKLPHR
ncbi:MAG: rsgA [Chlorobi bacterium]|nr:rsgA [Chlorobiota bacterium]